MLSGTLSQLLSYTGFAVVLFSGVAVASLFVLRWRDGRVDRPYSTWGYPVAPAVFVLAAAVLVLNEIVSRPGSAFAGLGIMAAGVPVYWWIRADGAPRWTRSRRAATRHSRPTRNDALTCPRPRQGDAARRRFRVTALLTWRR